MPCHLRIVVSFRRPYFGWALEIHDLYSTAVIQQSDAKELVRNVCKMWSLAIVLGRSVVWRVFLGFTNKSKAILRASSSIFSAVCVWNGICLLMKHPASLAALLHESHFLMYFLREYCQLLHSWAKMSFHYKTKLAVPDSWFVIPLVWM